MTAYDRSAALGRLRAGGGARRLPLQAPVRGGGAPPLVRLLVLDLAAAVGDGGAGAGGGGGGRGGGGAGSGGGVAPLGGAEEEILDGEIRGQVEVEVVAVAAGDEAEIPKRQVVVREVEVRVEEVGRVVAEVEVGGGVEEGRLRHGASRGGFSSA